MLVSGLLLLALHLAVCNTASTAQKLGGYTWTDGDEVDHRHEHADSHHDTAANDGGGMR